MNKKIKAWLDSSYKGLEPLNPEIIMNDCGWGRLWLEEQWQRFKQSWDWEDCPVGKFFSLSRGIVNLPKNFMQFLKDFIKFLKNFIKFLKEKAKEKETVKMVLLIALVAFFLPGSILWMPLLCK